MSSITTTGLVATTPRYLITAEGLEILSFRLASTVSDSITNWYTITAFRELATSCRDSIEKGHRVVVSGNLKIRDWDNGERTGTSVEVEADVIGHDLNYGTTTFTRTNLVATHSCDCNKCERKA
jgi:single-strand DNA-binding protein